MKRPREVAASQDRGIRENDTLSIARERKNVK